MHGFFSLFQVVNQYYEAEVVSEYVIRGNTAILKCNIPSFVADFVHVDAWIRTDGLEYFSSDDYGITQHTKLPCSECVWVSVCDCCLKIDTNLSILFSYYV